MSLPSGSLPNVKMMKAANLRNFPKVQKASCTKESAGASLPEMFQERGLERP